MTSAWDALNQGGSARRVNALLEPSLAEVTPPRHAESLVSTTAKFVLIANGELDTALRMCDALIDLARPQGWLIALAHGSFMRAIALMQCGRIHDARDDAQLSFEFKQGNSPAAALVWSLFPLVDALTELGALDDADSALERGRRTGEPPEAFLGTTLLLERRAHLRLAQHRYDEAHADLTVAADWWRRLRIRHPGVATWRVDDSEALVALGRPEEAQELAREHLALAERTGLPAPRAAGLRALARTTDPDQAIGLLRKPSRCWPTTRPGWSTPGHRSTSAPRCAGRTSARPPGTRYGRRSTWPSKEACACWQPAPAPSCSRAVRPRRSALIGIEALTPAERQAAVLAAEGLGNREIAQRLFVTRRTVETHLTHAFAEFGHRQPHRPWPPVGRTAVQCRRAGRPAVGQRRTSTRSIVVKTTV